MADLLDYSSFRLVAFDVSKAASESDFQFATLRFDTKFRCRSRPQLISSQSTNPPAAISSICYPRTLGSCGSRVASPAIVDEDSY